MVIPTLQVSAGNADLGQREARMIRQECPYKEAWAWCPVEPEGAPRNVEGPEDPGVKNIMGFVREEEMLGWKARAQTGRGCRPLPPLPRHSTAGRPCLAPHWHHLTHNSLTT